MDHFDIPKFGKQFVLHEDELDSSILVNWNRCQIDNEYKLKTHPDLCVTFSVFGDTKIFLLGDIFDPRKTEESNQDVVDGLISSLNNFEQMEKRLSSLAGRWVCIARICNEVRIYHDAAGLKTVYYHKGANKLTIASQPSLMEAVGITSKNPELSGFLDSFENPPAFWPIHSNPYSKVEQLLPNHTLSLKSWDAIRYWPNKELSPLPLEKAASLMSELLSGTISSMINRRKCTLSLSGGYDSRLLLAHSVPHWDQMEFVTKTAKGHPSHDVSIAKKLARGYKLNHNVYQIERDDLFIQTISRNVGDMYNDFSLKGMKTACKAYHSNLVLQGTATMGTKCHYYKNGIHPNEITPESLCRISHYGDNSIALKGISKWLEGVPKYNYVKTLDLAFWEQCVGICIATGLSLRESMFDLIPQTNCREFLETGLRTDSSNRIKPYPLIREMISKRQPNLLEIPFNWDIQDTWRNSFIARSKIPWRLKKILKLV